MTGSGHLQEIMLACPEHFQYSLHDTYPEI